MYLSLNIIKIPPNAKHLWGRVTNPSRYMPVVLAIKKLKLSKMNSTCSMKAWHRCVALLGPPGRLRVAHGPVSREKCREVNWKKRLHHRAASHAREELTGCIHRSCLSCSKKICVDNSRFYLCAFEESLETNRSTAVTLVPIAPPGGRGQP